MTMKKKKKKVPSVILESPKMSLPSLPPSLDSILRWLCVFVQRSHALSAANASEMVEGSGARDDLIGKSEEGGQTDGRARGE